MPIEVRATPRAEQQIDSLDRKDLQRFNDFLDDLAIRGCKALAYRLTGTAPIDHLCVKHLAAQLRVVVAFESVQRAWVLLVGPHDDSAPIIDVYSELYRLLGVLPPDLARRTKPPCCDDENGMPPSLGDELAEILDRATQIRRTRRARSARRRS